MIWRLKALFRWQRTPYRACLLAPVLFLFLHWF